MHTILALLLLAATPISEHATDIPAGEVTTRRIQTDINYRDSGGTLHASEDAVTEAGPYTFNTRDFQFRKQSRITLYAGVTDAVSNHTLIAMVSSNKPAAWLAIRMVGPDNVMWTKHDGHTLKWLDVLPNCNLWMRASRKSVDKLFECDGAPGQAYLEWEYTLPSAAAVSADGGTWSAAGGGESYTIGQATCWDSDNGSRFGPYVGATLIDCVTTLESNVVDGVTRTVVFRITPDAGQVTAAWGAGKTVYID